MRFGAYVDTELEFAPTLSTTATDDSKWLPVRKARPANVLLPATIRWLAMIAPDVKPRALATEFPRLANRIAADWGNAEACRAFLYQLLVDRRGGRKGFPREVLRDILDLRALYRELNPALEGHTTPFR